jgi:hypothetical protein
MKRVSVVAIMALGLLAATMPAAHAKPVKDGIRVKHTHQFEDPFFADFLEVECGVPNLRVDVIEKVNLWEAEGRVFGHVGVKARVTNTDTGQWAVQSFSIQIDQNFAETLSDDGLLTITFDDTYTGLDTKWHAPGQGVIVRDAGSINFVGEVVIDTTIEDGDPLVSIMEEIITKGPHPWVAEQGGGPTPEQGAAICGALGG